MRWWRPHHKSTATPHHSFTGHASLGEETPERIKLVAAAHRTAIGVTPWSLPPHGAMQTLFAPFESADVLHHSPYAQPVWDTANKAETPRQ